MRDRDVRNAIQAAMIATNAFDLGAVWMWAEDQGTPASQSAAAMITPMSSRQEDLWDSAPGGGLLITSLVKIEVAYRGEDAQTRDEGAELLLDTTANALNGQSLGGLILPQTARMQGWNWQETITPERRIQATFSYQYIVEGWDSYDTTP